MTAPQTLTIARTARDTYVLPSSPQPAILTLSSWRSEARLSVAGAPYELTKAGIFDRTVTAQRSGQNEPIVRIGGRSCLLPSGQGAVWKVSRGWHGYTGTLGADDLGEIQLQLGRRARSDIVVDIVGDWPERDLVLLTAAFALLLRRRKDTATRGGGAATIAVAASC